MAKRQAVRAIVLHDGKLLAMKRNKFGDQYYTLIGGGIDAGEDEETALRRELREETGMEVGDMHKVFVSDDGDYFGMQHVYLCDYKGGEPVLAFDSEERAINAMGEDTYEPVWLPLNELSRTNFRSSLLADALLKGIQNGFPETIQELA